MTENINLEFLSRKIDQVLEQGRRLDQQHLQVLEALSLLQRTVINLDRRISDVDRRLTDVKDELELTIKVEIGGRLANAETRIEASAQGRTQEVLDVLTKMFAEENVVSFERFAKAGREALDLLER